MIQVVLDTNVVISAYLNPDGAPFRVLKLALTGLVRLYVSLPILAEYKDLLTRKSYPLDKRRAALLFSAIRSASTVVRPVSGLPLSLPDPDDAMFLVCAEAAKADYLITGNTKHFPAKWKITKRVTPAAFLAVWYAAHSKSEYPKE
ncbi:MAG: putative toxin-antitoxin system toxin component, PIN family [Acidobacteria bacterium]|nr:putative toxin-antitoxin system toxin component, PIN family [Acidobacteriota bacterium]